MTTICVIARAPLEGRCKPKISDFLGPEFTAKLCAAMLRDTLDGLNAIEVDRHVTTYLVEEGADAMLARHVHPPWTLSPQPEGDLGAAIVHAEETFGKDGPLLLARSDSPTAATEDAERALARLSKDEVDVVLAPTADGGFHFIATRSFTPALFEGIPWGTPEVNARIRAVCSDLSLRLEELPEHYDVDSPQDLERLTAELKAHPDRAPRTAEFLLRNGW